MKFGRLKKLISVFLLTIFVILNIYGFSANATNSTDPNTETVIEIHQASGKVFLDGYGKHREFGAKTGRAGKRLPIGEKTIALDYLAPCETGSDGECLTNEKGFFFPKKYIIDDFGKKHFSQVADLVDWGNSTDVLFVPIYLGEFTANGGTRLYGTVDGVPAIHSDITYCDKDALDWYMQSTNPINYFYGWDGSTISVSPRGNKCYAPARNFDPNPETFGCIRLIKDELNETYDLVYKSKLDDKEIKVKIFR